MCTTRMLVVWNDHFSVRCKIESEFNEEHNLVAGRNIIINEWIEIDGARGGGGRERGREWENGDLV